MLRLRHGKTTPHFTSRERQEVVLLLLGGAVVHQDLHVPNVRRLAVKKVVPDWCAAEFFTHEREFGQRET